MNMDQSLKEEYRKAKDRLQEASRAYEAGKYALLGQGFVVTVEGVPINYDNRTKQVTWAHPDRAMRFTSKDARKLALRVRNGNGYNGEVNYWMSLMPDYMKELEHLISVIEEYFKEKGVTL